jgi:hypothetical protein
MAADILWDTLDGPSKHKLLEQALKLFNGIGLHEQFLHVDIRDNNVVWFY